MVLAYVDFVSCWFDGGISQPKNNTLTIIEYKAAERWGGSATTLTSDTLSYPITRVEHYLPSRWVSLDLNDHKMKPSRLSVLVGCLEPRRLRTRKTL